MKTLRILSILFISALLGLALTAGGYYLAVTANVRLDENKLLLSDEQTAVFAADGTKLAGCAYANGQARVRIDELPDHTKRAFVDTEDKRFFSHGGFDVLRMGKAAIKNVTSGAFKEGASTISQQLIKNTHLTQEKTIKRKLQEIKLTAQLERRFGKNEILEKYVNSIYFGHSCFGIRSAAKFYFGKEVGELTLSESAILAGLVRSPNNYSPFKNPSRCVSRRQTVLRAMLAQGHISNSEYEQANAQPLPEHPVESTGGESYLRFVFDELESLAEKYAFTVGGNIRIDSFLDVRLQKELERTVQNLPYDKSAMILDKASGGFKAAYSTVGNVKRSPASVIKPLLVYAPAMEENLLSPATPILDEKIDFYGYAPENFGGEYHGYVSAREAIAKSLNVPAVKVLNGMGVKKGAEYLAKLGLGIDREDESLALALGGMREGYTLRDLCEGYDALLDGNKQACGFIKEIFIDGRSVYKKKARKKRVFTAETAYLISDCLKSTAKEGTAKCLRSLPFDVAAKTGTAGTKEKNTDAYTLSYTAKDVVGVWLGNASGEAIDCLGGGLPCRTSMQIYEFLYGNNREGSGKDGFKTFPPPFVKPKNVVSAKLDKSEYYVMHNIVLADDNSPSKFVTEEVFKTACLPTKKCDKFSIPAISAPSLRVERDGTSIRFLDKDAPLYDYTVTRYDYVRHTTVYEGAYVEEIKDLSVQEGKRYVYTIIPSYNGRKGKPITLPEVLIGKLERENLPPPEITKKEWWEY